MENMMPSAVHETTQDTAITASGLRKSYGAQVVLDGIDLSIERGSIFALLGPNGAGKTTLINILSTLSLADAGSAAIAGHDVSTDSGGVRGSISLTGQFAAVDPVLTGEENLVMIAKLFGFSTREAHERSRELLEQFDLTEFSRKRVKTYSGGIRRRLDIALGLVASPPVLFLDEPTTGLDTRSRQALWSLILELAKSGVTILLTTQYLEEADILADRIALIDHGRIVAEGTAAELKARIGGEVVELRDASDEIVHEVPTDGTIDGLREALDAIGAFTRPEDGTRVSIRQPSLDDVFLALTGTAPRSTFSSSDINQIEGAIA
jgi:ABC-2 type transport system ATP-binding protein